jgi:hypothetical protein
MSEKPRNEKEEKNEKDEGESWDEKWRRDPVEAAVWAFVLIWAGLVWLLSATTNFWDSLLGRDGDWWALAFLGAGVIILLGVLFRLLVPAYRRPLTGSIIIGFVFLGIGLGTLTDLWLVVGPLILIAIGAGLLLTGIFRRRE